MTIHFEKAGQGFPLVLLHGIGSNSRSWRRQIEGLSDQFTVLAWDAPGYGQSSDPETEPPSMQEYARSLKRLLDDQRMDSVILLGHSMGGLIAQEFYRVYPQCLTTLILSDTTRGGANAEKLRERLDMIRTMTPAQLAEQRAPKLLSTHAPPPVVRKAVSIMSEIRPTGYRFAALAMAQADYRGLLPTVKVPTLLIWGAEDEITPLVEGEIMRAAIPGSRLEVIPKAGHLCYLEQPDCFNAIVRDFLRASAPPR